MGRMTLSPSHVHKHGSSTCYVHCKCRCVDCRAGNSAREQKRTRQKAYGRYEHPWVPIEPVRSHVEILRAAGMGYKTIAARAGVGNTTVRGVIYGREDYLPDGTHGPRHGEVKKQIGREQARKILAVLPTLENLPSTAHVPGLATTLRLRALVAIGWSQSELARRIGMEPSNVTRIFQGPEFVRASTARNVATLYDDLANEKAPRNTHRQKISAARSENRARAAGWATPARLQQLQLARSAKVANVDVAPPVKDAAHLRIGRPVELVRFVSTLDGARAETVAGTFCGRSRAGWLLEIDGAERRFDRDQWNECVA